MIYARKQGGPRLYIGAVAADPTEDADALRARILSTPIGTWFDEVDLVVNMPRG
jgi:hypothetical protein